MPTYKGQVLVTYEIHAENAQKAYDALYYDTEHPIFPNGIGSCIDDEVISVEEV